jgi:hypothetical protein
LRCNAGDVFSSPATKLADSILKPVVCPSRYGGAFDALEGGDRCFVRAGAIADDFPSKPNTNLPKRNRFDVPKHDNIFRVE